MGPETTFWSLANLEQLPRKCTKWHGVEENAPDSLRMLPLDTYMRQLVQAVLNAHQSSLKFLLTIKIADTAPLSAPGPLTAKGAAFLFAPPTRNNAEFDLRDALLFFSSSPPKADKLHDPAKQSMASVLLQHASKFTQHE